MNPDNIYNTFINTSLNQETHYFYNEYARSILDHPIHPIMSTSQHSVYHQPISNNNNTCSQQVGDNNTYSQQKIESTMFMN